MTTPLARVARVAFAVLLIMSGPTAALATAAPAGAARAAAPIELGRPITALSPTLPAHGSSGAPARPHARMDLLQQLLSTSRGRALLRGGLGARDLNALQRIYGKGAAARPARPAGGRVAARVGAAAQGSAQGKMPTQGKITVARRVPTLVAPGRLVRAGDAVRLTGSGFRPGQLVTVSLPGRAVGAGAGAGAARLLVHGGTDSAGLLVPLRVDLPAGLPAGPARLVARDAAGEQAVADVLVLPAAAPATLAGRLASPAGAPSKSGARPNIAGGVRAATGIKPAIVRANATTRNVCPSGCAYSNIQSAINAASDGDTISVGAGTYNERLTIAKSLTIAGAGAGQTIIDGQYGGTVVTVNANYATVTISDVTIQHGYLYNGGNGGGISNTGYNTTLTLSSSTVQSNIVYGASGASDGAGSQGGYGGDNGGSQAACVNLGSGGTGGGGNGPTRSGTAGGAAYGGGIYNGQYATLHVDHSTITGNSVYGGDGGGGASGGQGGQGGKGQPSDCGNPGSGGTGGNGADGSNGHAGGVSAGGGVYNDGGTATVDHSTVVGNHAIGGAGGGGGSGGKGGTGGSGGDATLGNCNDGGTGGTGGDAGQGSGGGVANGNNGALTVSTSTLVNNAANSGTGGGSGGRGGGGDAGSGGGGAGYHFVCTSNGGSSGSGGSSDGSGGAATNSYGGAAHNDNGATNLTSDTINSNTVGGPGSNYGGGVARAGGTVIVKNTILAGNTGSGAAPDCYGSGGLTSQGYNVLSSTTGCTGFTSTGDQVNVNPQLGPLQNNGGATQTEALLSGSPALDSGSCTDTSDQRDAPRPDPVMASGHCDIGAYEYAHQRFVASSGGADGNDCLTAASACATIGAAIGKAYAGDRIMVADGTYNEHLTIGKSLTLVGAGVGQTVIDGTSNGRVVTVGSGVSARISGVTIQNGSAPSYTRYTGFPPRPVVVHESGGGIANNGTLTLISSTVSGNTAASASAGGIYNSGTLAVISSTVSGNTTGGSNNGGGIANAGGATLTLTASTINGNTAAGNGGGIENAGTATLINSTLSGNSATSGVGGAVHNTGTLRLFSATVAGNSASTGGGISVAGGTATTANTLLAGNTASSTGPDCAGTLSSGNDNLLGNSSGCTFTSQNNDKVGTAGAPIDPLLGPLANNGGPTRTRAILPGSPAIAAGSYSCADYQGHALATDQRGVARPDPSSRCDIGAYQSRTLSVAPAPTGADSATCGAAGSPCATIRQALANGSSGDTVSVAAGTYAERLDLTKSVALQGAGVGQTVVDGSSGGAVLTVEKGAIVGVSGVTIQNGRTPQGGGVFNSGTLTLRNATVTSNTATGNGGGIDNGGTLAVISSTVSAGSAGGNGGGVYNENHGTLTLTGTTLSGNTATGDGAGLYNRDGTATLVDSTVSGNSTTGGRGGGIANGGTLRLYSVTVSGNSAASGGGIDSAGNTSLAGTLLAGNIASGTDPDCHGNLTTGGYNLLGDNAGCTGLTNGANGDKVGTAGAPIDPLLRPLAGNGGPTRTMAPLPGSPAVDAVGAGGCKDAQGVALTTDQRGLVRPDPTSGRCDIGAYETHTLFVATAANGGDDGHDCLLAIRACATVAAALRKASAGDTVSLDTGTYTETVDLATSVPCGGPAPGRQCSTAPTGTLWLELGKGSSPAWSALQSSTATRRTAAASTSMAR